VAKKKESRVKNQESRLKKTRVKSQESRLKKTRVKSCELNLRKSAGILWKIRIEYWVLRFEKKENREKKHEPRLNNRKQESGTKNQD